MLYINTKDNIYPYSIDVFRKDNFQTSFPEEITESLLAEWSVFPVIPIAKPEYDLLSQNIIEEYPIKIDNKWIQQWSVITASFDEITTKKLKIKNNILQKTQQRLDQFAQTRDYDNILSCCTYATDPVQKFAQEGQYCVQARSATWAQLFQIFDNADAGLRPFPQSYTDIEPELPPLQWPV